MIGPANNEALPLAAADPLRARRGEKLPCENQITTNERQNGEPARPVSSPDWLRNGDRVKSRSGRLNVRVAMADVADFEHAIIEWRPGLTLQPRERL
jgi:hypothetical protein